VARANHCMISIVRANCYWKLSATYRFVTEQCNVREGMERAVTFLVSAVGRKAARSEAAPRKGESRKWIS
jgi:hypothetical protein